MATLLPPPADAPSWKFSPSILAVWLVGFLPLEAAPIWIPAAQIHYAVSPVSVGMVASLQFMVAAISALFLAPVLARRPLKPPLLAAMGVITLTAILSAALHPGFPLFILLRVVEAAGSGICIAEGAVLASRTPKPSRSFGAMQFGQIIANMIMYGLSTRLVVEHGLPGLYWMITDGMAGLLAVTACAKGWPVALLPAAPGAAGPVPARIIIACIGVAVIYCGFISLVANANALGGRAGLSFAQVTVVLAVTTPAGALGSLTAMLLAGRVPGFFMIAVSAAGIVGFGLLLILAGYDFQWLTLSLCGVIMCIYIGVPSLYSGIAGLELTGRAAAFTQATQFLGPVTGPAVGAIIATHSVTLFASVGIFIIAGGILVSATAIWPALKRDMAPAGGESKTAAARLGRAV